MDEHPGVRVCGHSPTFLLPQPPTLHPKFPCKQPCTLHTPLGRKKGSLQPR